MDPSKTFTLNRKWLWLNVFLVLALVGCGQRDAAFTNDSSDPVAVNVMTLEEVSETFKKLTFFGKISPDRELALGFTVPGSVQFLTAHGVEVAAGEPLARLDSSELEANRGELQAQMELAENQPQIPALQAQIASLDEQIAARTIVAPFDCLVDEVFTFESSVVRPQSPVLKIVASGNPKIDIVLPARIARSVDSFPEIYFDLGGSYVVGSLAEKSKTEKAGGIACRFNVDSDIGNLDYQFGQTVEVGFNFGFDHSGYWVPLSALERSAEGVWSLLQVQSMDNGYSVIRKLVTVIQVVEQQALVSGDLANGVEVISDGIHRVVPGQSVQVQRSSSEPPVNDEDAGE